MDGTAAAALGEYGRLRRGIKTKENEIERSLQSALGQPYFGRVDYVLPGVCEPLDDRTGIEPEGERLPESDISGARANQRHERHLMDGSRPQASSMRKMTSTGTRPPLGSFTSESI